MSGSKDERELGKLSSALERAQAELTKREQALEAAQAERDAAFEDAAAVVRKKVWRCPQTAVIRRTRRRGRGRTARDHRRRIGRLLPPRAAAAHAQAQGSPWRRLLISSRAAF